MATLGNTPKTQTVLRLAARKSFSFGLLVTDANGKALDLTGSTIRFVSKPAPFDPSDLDDSDNLIVNATAVAVEPTEGYVRFDLQASDLNHDAGEYPFVIAILDGGYSSILVSGPLEIIDNPEFDSADETYDDLSPATALQVWMRRRNVIKVTTGYITPPGHIPFTSVDKDKLDSLGQPDWDINTSNAPGYIWNRPLNKLVPDPAAPSMLLQSNGAGEGQFGWTVKTFEIGEYADVEDPDDEGFFIPPVGAFSILSAEGAANGAVPTANGADSWGWALVPLPEDLDEVPDSATRLAMTPEERTQLSQIVSGGTVTDWNAESGDVGYIANKPTLGTAAEADTTDFLPASGIDGSDVVTGTVAAARLPMVSDMTGWAHGTGAPTGGPGTIYLKHA